MKRIVFTEIGKAELWDVDLLLPKAGEVLVEMAYTAISAGTERAVLMRMPNTQAKANEPAVLGYSGSGIVKAIGEGVRSVKVGDRVLCIWGTHSQFNTVPERKVIKIEADGLKLEHAAFALIAAFSAAGIRKTRLEFGESALVFGMGILGAFAVQICRAAGAFPVIAADPLPQRRRLALDLGADCAFDPKDGSFYEAVKSATDGRGANAIVEVTGKAESLNQALHCAAPLGRISLLGCTRVSDAAIDYYQQIHKPGVTIVGAHTNARPKLESQPHNWTERDDCLAMLNFMAHGRVEMSKILSEVCSPQDAPAVYRRLAENKDFPVGVVFDWTRLKERRDLT